MKIFVWILPVLFYHLFSLELTASPRSACLWLKIFDLARGWFGMFVVLPSGVVPSTVPISFILRVGEIQLWSWASKRGKSRLQSRDCMCFRGGKPNQRSRGAGTLGGKILVALRVGKSHIAVTCMYVGEPLLLSPSERNPIPIKVQGVGCSSEMHIQACNVTFSKTMLDA